jgi:hypothetical protein
LIEESPNDQAIPPANRTNKGTGGDPEHGGLEVSDARRLKALEDENAKLKKLLAEAMLDNAMLKDIASKKW